MSRAACVARCSSWTLAIEDCVFCVMILFELYLDRYNKRAWRFHRAASFECATTREATSTIMSKYQHSTTFRRIGAETIGRVELDMSLLSYNKSYSS